MSYSILSNSRILYYPLSRNGRGVAATEHGMAGSGYFGGCVLTVLYWSTLVHYSTKKLVGWWWVVKQMFKNLSKVG